ncbi:site-2 protease family protein [Candidatus Marinimicrobia bacterium]|jgi:Zn-dependent protease|nr:site-2 protease family protein [Candidatus Neomarinimicrobiota bacterium]MDA9841542.1 site-2 protease family protein [Candidatus Neomarinimicrobiota bacterium]MDB3887747.1 site-2 protease family protein [Candidatus Neomarinimicrobiota bacterium]MDC0521334.1 site-2 protease family protein [Candidatus Neomarinimicrobiota bacterium]MDC1145989.1 site-2 protease family protein [Candidatus Neomarinimicrobiota bacterium]|tara:strand:+ start:1406 stop:2044 length:639 start_codon:yes stop_codon:yes gene_type:complete
MGIASAPLEMQLIVMPCILFALTFHEYAHARVAYYLGDYTAYYQDRMNLNPISHLDPIGTLALYFLGFGWAKPVPVNMRNLSKPRTDMMLIAIAGPASNIFLAIIGSIFLRFSTIAPFSIPELFTSAMIFFVFINIVLALFNLIPIAPLDGSRLLPLFIRDPRTLYQIEYYGPRVLMGLVLLSLIGGLSIFSFVIFEPAKLIFNLLTGINLA